jgi:Sulfotransferase family
MGSAMSWWENSRQRTKITATELAEQPVFVIGHWRSGTTLLHSLMSLDKRFGYLSNSQALLPNAMFMRNKLLRGIVDFHLMPKRPMDDVSLSPESPQEEEFAMASLFGEGAYLGWYFPDKFASYFEKYALLEGMTPAERASFSANYKWLVQKMTRANGGKPLVLKNPVNTGRVDMLLELFPNAKFVYLQRDCAEVYLSTLRLHTKLIEQFSFQDRLPDDLEDFTVNFYRRIIQKYESDKALIPPGQLVETTYEDLTKRPLDTLQRIYEDLRLPNFEVARPEFARYMEEQKRSYRPAKYQISNQTAEDLRHAMSGELQAI